MSGAKHTPGPWSVDDLEISAGTQVVAHVMGPDDFPCLDADEDDALLAEADANARLIAAAPDLLAALREADEYMSNFLTMDDPRWAQVRAAIAKAEGRS